MAEGDIVVVTGAAGFLGQHIVHLLQEKTSVREIRVFDIKPYVNKMGHKERVPVKKYVGDLRRQEDLDELCRGADVVFHIASLISVRPFPDYKLLEEINVQGTANVIDACAKQGVSRLVYTSSIDVVVEKGWQDFSNAVETKPYPRKHIFRGYAGTKCRAEQLVLVAHGKPLSQGGHLRTLSIRPLSMYGENDGCNVTQYLHAANQTGGTFVCMTGAGVQSLAYAGNTAWAHVMAAQKLQEDHSVGGQAFFITDQTPNSCVPNFVEPFFKARGFTISKVKIPFWVLYYTVCVFQLLCYLIRKLQPETMSRSSLMHIRRNMTFSGQKARDVLGYRPLFSYQQSFERSLKFYKDVPL